MNNSLGLWISLFVLIQLSCICGQRRRADGLGFIPRTPQNAKRNEQRLSAIKRIKYMNEMAFKNNNNNMNNGKTGMNMFQNSMQANNNMNNRRMGMNNNNMNNHRMGMNNNNNMNNGPTGMNYDNNMNNGPTGMNTNGGQMNVAHMNPEYVESMMDLPGGMQMLMNARMGNGGMTSSGVTIINTEMSEMGMMQNGMMGNNGRRMGRRGQQKMRLPMCQPLSECAERFIPPQCRAWRYDTMNSVMCRACPTNRCEGGAKEYFNTMYKYHPSRLMLKMLQ